MTTTTTKKRKATTSASAGTASKKSKLGEEGADQVKQILADASNVDSELLKLAQYARWLEEEISALKPKPKSADDIENEAEKLRASVRSGIVKQMGVRAFLSLSITANLTSSFSGNHPAKLAARNGRMMESAMTPLYSAICLALMAPLPSR